MTGIPDAVQAAVKAVSDLAWPFAVAMAAVGVVSMAFIQTVKDMLPVRRWFQQWWVKGWLQDRARQAATTAGVAVDAEAAEGDLIRLTTSGDPYALYDLAIEQLTAQMNAAVQIVLDYPREHRDLLLSLGAWASPDDLRLLLNPPAPARKPRSELTEAERGQVTALVDARNRVAHMVQRSLDGLQIAAGYRWKYLLQIVSIVLSGLLVVFALFVFTNQPIMTPRRLGLYAVAAVLGGFLAPVARDLVAALQQLRK
jgi:hypothetical protein